MAPSDASILIEAIMAMREPIDVLWQSFVSVHIALFALLSTSIRARNVCNATGDGPDDARAGARGYSLGLFIVTIYSEPDRSLVMVTQRDPRFRKRLTPALVSVTISCNRIECMSPWRR